MHILYEQLNVLIELVANCLPVTGSFSNQM